MELLIAIVIIVAILISGFLFAQNDRSHRKQIDSDTIEKLLPQTQCRDCGFDGCKPYAEALAKNETDINRCLPGGMETIKDLARLLKTKVKPLYKETDKYKTPAVAVIDEAQCIGCVKCIVACPMDAIIGAPKQMHSVIDMYCTGCELCIAPCPVDCISMLKQN